MIPTAMMIPMIIPTLVSAEGFSSHSGTFVSFIEYPEKLSLKSEPAQVSSRDFLNIIYADFLKLGLARFVCSWFI